MLRSETVSRRWPVTSLTPRTVCSGGTSPSSTFRKSATVRLQHTPLFHFNSPHGFKTHDNVYILPVKNEYTSESMDQGRNVTVSSSAEHILMVNLVLCEYRDITL